MTVQLGAESRVYANGRDLSDYLTEFGVSVSIDALDKTTFGSARVSGAKSYHPGLVDGQLAGAGFFDADTVNTDAVDDVLGAAIASETIFCYFPSGDAVGSDGYACPAIKTSYGVSEPVAELGKVSISGQSDVGRERVESVHELSQETVSGNGDTVDDGASSAAGGYAYLQVTDLTNPATLDVKIQHSADGSAWVDHTAFTQVTAKQVAERIELDGTINRYVRCVWALSASDAATFSVAVGRN